MLQKVRKVGNSLVVTIPKDQAEQLDIHAGDMVELTINKVEVHTEVRRILPPHVQEALDRTLREHEDAYRYLADR